MSTGYGNAAATGHDYTAEDNFDWSNGQASGGGDDFEFPSYTSAADVDQMEADNAGFRSPPPGTHLFTVVRATKGPDKIQKSYYLGKTSTPFEVYSITLKFAVVGNPGQTMFDFFWMPAGSPKDQQAFQHGCKNPDGKNPGVMCRKTEFFLKKLGFPIVYGQPLPKEALNPKNWFGRQVYATVQTKKEDENSPPRIDPQTGEPFPPRMEFKMNSYKEATSPNGAPAAGSADAAAGQQAAASPPPPGTHADRFARAPINI